ncbi:Agrin [Portunus trituberculatus]|uniref:Agrin n=1 Tax=Portunus trituberculatus TaxID=210409 RepID=A0A5B7GQ94_PORTR|nr:Agrin [Portunus trituberculatus]
MREEVILDKKDWRSAGDGGGGEPGCQTICPEVYDPVCGSNSKTYDNLCKLNNAHRCESRCITLRAQGPCAHTCGNPCPFSNEGVCGTDGNTYPNQCMLEEAACHNSCLAARHKGPCNYKPVCGSNSKTYSNLCGLNSATVCDDPCITLRHEGPCEHTCGEPCPLLLDQQLAVCGSDGTTYLSKCHLEEAACQKPCLTQQHNGPCGSQGCAILCPLHIDPVCGTDGKTYSNMCALTAAARCNNDPCLSLRAVGPCSRECGDPCPGIIGGASVCGSDGTKYPSQCHLEEAACHNHCLVMEDESRCDGHLCPMVCPYFFDPVCGTNGITYMNMCTLNNASVCISDCIRLRGKGPCSWECGDPCPAPGPSDAVCGSDSITYLSQCHLDEAACRNPCISTAHAGPCGGECCRGEHC